MTISIGRSVRDGWRAIAFALALAVAVPILTAPAAVLAQGLSYEQGLRAFESGDLSTAYDVWRQLAEEGDAAAEYGVGVILERGGGGIEQDVEEAAQWYRRAADKGLASAQNNLGLLYARGRGVPRNPSRAVEFWRKAAEQQHHMAEYNLGLAYYRGAGVDEDRAQAKEWFEKAASGGLADSQFALGQLYRMGIGASKDQERALAWYQRAAEQGHPDARRYAEELQAMGIQAASLSERPASKPPQSAAAQAPRREPETVETAEMPEPPPKRQAETSAMSKAVEAEPEPTPKNQPATKTETPSRTGSAGSGQDTASGRTQAANVGANGGFHVWLASAKSPSAAQQFWATARNEKAVLSSANLRIREVTHGSNVFYRVLAGPYGSEAEAAGLCRDYRQSGESDDFCKIVR
jgi:TPR repeat protein